MSEATEYATPFMRDCAAILLDAEDADPTAIVGKLMVLVVETRRIVASDNAIPNDDALTWLREIGRRTGNGGALPMAMPQFFFNYINGYSAEFIADLINECPHKEVLFGEYSVAYGMQLMGIPKDGRGKRIVLTSNLKSPKH